MRKFLLIGSNSNRQPQEQILEEQKRTDVIAATMSPDGLTVDHVEEKVRHKKEVRVIICIGITPVQTTRIADHVHEKLHKRKLMVYAINIPFTTFSPPKGVCLVESVRDIV